MQKRKLKNLKGFTLVEMLVVIAIFGMIMAVALGLLDPIGRIFKNSNRARDRESISENMRRYVEDQIQYADRIQVFTNMSLTDAHVKDQVDEFRKAYGFVDETKEVNLGAGNGGTKEVTLKRKLPSSKFEDDIYVMRIDNSKSPKAFEDSESPEEDPESTEPPPFEGSVIDSSLRVGTITIERYHLGEYVSGSRKTWAIDAGYYDDYAFVFKMQTLSDAGVYMPLSKVPKSDDGVMAKNFAIGIDMYEKVRVKGNHANSVVQNVYLNRTITFRLKNILNHSGAITSDLIEYIPYTVPGSGNKVDLGTRNEPRFAWYDTVKPDAKKLSFELSDAEKNGNDIMFIFTKSPRIENYTK